MASRKKSIYLILHRPSNHVTACVVEGGNELLPPETMPYRLKKMGVEDKAAVEKLLGNMAWLLCTPNEKALKDFVVLQVSASRRLRELPNSSAKITAQLSLTEFLHTETGRRFAGPDLPVLEEPTPPRRPRRGPRMGDIRDDLLRLHREGHSVRGIAEKLGTNKSNVGRWLQRLMPTAIQTCTA